MNGVPQGSMLSALASVSLERPWTLRPEFLVMLEQCPLWLKLPTWVFVAQAEFKVCQQALFSGVFFHSLHFSFTACLSLASPCWRVTYSYCFHKSWLLASSSQFSTSMSSDFKSLTIFRVEIGMLLCKLRPKQVLRKSLIRYEMKMGKVIGVDVVGAVWRGWT